MNQTCEASVLVRHQPFGFAASCKPMRHAAGRWRDGYKCVVQPVVLPLRVCFQSVYHLRVRSRPKWYGDLAGRLAGTARAHLRTSKQCWRWSRTTKRLSPNCSQQRHQPLTAPNSSRGSSKSSRGSQQSWSVSRTHSGSSRKGKRISVDECK